jgi:toxin ParE1/3/4
LPSDAEAMPLRIRRSRLAQLDQNGIWLAVAEDSISSADGVLERINTAIFMLAEQPAAGRERGELKPGLRYFPVGSYLIFYTIAFDAIEIRRVMHGARNITAELFED